MRARDPEELARDAERVPAHDRRRRLHGEQDVARPCAGDVERDLGARVAGADDEHPAAAIEIAAAVVRRVDELAAERSRPVGQERHAAVPRRDDDPSCDEALAAGSDGPALGDAVDALHPMPGADVQLVAARVPAEVVDDSVA